MSKYTCALSKVTSLKPNLIYAFPVAFLFSGSPSMENNLSKVRINTKPKIQSFNLMKL